MSLVEDLLHRIQKMPEDEKKKLKAVAEARASIWFPNPGPQTEAFESPADELFYGGSAGGG